MKYATVSVKFPKELNRELEQFLEETGVYTNKSELIKESIRRHLIELNNEPAIAALRVEQLLARAEEKPVSDDERHGRLDEFCQRIDDGLEYLYRPPQPAVSSAVTSSESASRTTR